MEKEIYLDNAATTQVDTDAAHLAFEVMTSLYGNPSSAHAKGLEAEHLLKKARAQVLSCAGYTQKEASAVFTSCGTEASGSAILSAYKALGKRKHTAIISDSEHPSVENTVCELEKSGVKVHRIPSVGGKLHLEFAEKVMTDDVFLISCMALNNETGAIYDVKQLGLLKKRKCPEAFFHVDAVQGFTHLPYSLSVFDADFISVSGHKIYAPKGVGALIIKKGTRFTPLLLGGGQEGTLRSGTENLPSICAFGLCCEKAEKEKSQRLAHIKELNLYARQVLSKECPFILFNTPCDGFASHILSVSVPGIRSEIMLRFLSKNKIYISAGSACSSKSADNRVLSAFGLDDKVADSTLRISFGIFNTKSDIDALAKAIRDGNGSLIHTLK